MYKLNYGIYFRPKQLDRKTRTFVSILINDFGFNLISIFIPIFLYIEGFSLSDIALFHIILFGTRMIITNFASRVMQDIGPSRSLQIGYISALLAIGSMIALTIADHLNHTLLIATAAIYGMNYGLYYFAKHINLEMITTEKDAGATAGWIRIFETIVIALAPLTGAFIVAMYGITAALSVAFAFVLLSVLYVIGEKNESSMIYNHKHENLRISDIKYDLLANLASTFDWSVAIFAWPLFIFIVVGQIEQVGAVATITGLAMIPLMVWVANNSDKKANRMLQIGSLIRTFVYPLRALISTFYMAVGVNALADIGDSIKGGGIMRHYYNRADKLGRLKYTYAMEMVASFGSLLAWLFIAMVSLFFDITTALQITFIATAFVVPFVILFNKAFNN